MDENKLYAECECHSECHLVKFEYIDDKDYPYFAVSTQLNTWLPWWKRVYYGIKYIFGGTEPYGHWDECLIKRDDVPKLIAMLGTFHDKAV